ncbi:DNA methyltransferase [Clostridium sp. BJN0013]|uniref:DNA methyltransferase n=1 Tax=Clostridium sp. BJN0013 TaxID=3236840 RepID=UPI0034C5D738
MDTNLLKRTKKILKDFPEYWKNQELQRYLVINDLRKYDISLISALLKDEKIKELYTLQVDNITIFKQEEFIDMFRYKQYWANSYTKYSNEIGLSSEGKYLKYNSDVVLDFPYKDCILEGGMTKEDVGKDEIYYNEIIAKDEIDTLLAPKVFTNAKMYDSEGIHEVTEITDEDNLIIKGNNLLALYSLKERYKNKIKLIYIDPPYNTGNDSFLYNNHFNHSTWLIFMKNRLEIAKELLADDGSLWMNIDDDEVHYLKVLADEVFGRGNFIANIIWQKKYSPQNDARFFSDMHDHILVFGKDISSLQLNGLPRTDGMNARYTNRDNDPRGPWKPGDFSVKTYSKEYDFPIITPSGRIVNPPSGRSWRTSKKHFAQLIKDNRIWFGNNGNNVPSIKRFLSEVKQSMPAGTIWSYKDVGHNQDARKESLLLFGNQAFSTPKPEKLLQRIITLGSNEGDLILDFFIGSATTQAVAMKMNRRFIGIEQMDYINTVSVPRLQQVIKGEQGGVSKEINWKGGGNFIYTELMQLNQFFINKILNCNSSEKLINILNEMKRDAYLDFKVNIKKLISQAVEIEGYDIKMSFKDLPLDKQKEILIGVLDKNQLYINYSDIDDEDYQISDRDKMFNHSFYQVRGGKLQCLKDYMKN